MSDEERNKKVEQLYNELESIISKTVAWMKSPPCSYCETPLLELLGRWNEIERELVPLTQESYYKFVVRNFMETKRAKLTPVMCKHCVKAPHVDHYICSSCGQTYLYDSLQQGGNEKCIIPFNYCPSCGAKLK